jgi:hypothetical protein
MKTYTTDKFKAWGKKGGQSKSEAKIAASIANGKKGGRPKTKKGKKNVEK